MGNKISETISIHNSIIEIERITKEELKDLIINYSYKESLFGEVLIASTHKGICYIGFSDDHKIAFSALENRFLNAKYLEKTDDFQKCSILFFSQDWARIKKIKLHIKGTDFQLKVWKTLLEIPLGKLSTYGEIAQHIQKPKAARAVGTAIGSNPIAFLIPCHRVVQSSGGIGGYMWGADRKVKIINWETGKD